MIFMKNLKKRKKDKKTSVTKVSYHKNATVYCYLSTIKFPGCVCPRKYVIYLDYWSKVKWRRQGGILRRLCFHVLALFRYFNRTRSAIVRISQTQESSILAVLPKSSADRIITWQSRRLHIKPSQYSPNRHYFLDYRRCIGEGHIHNISYQKKINSQHFVTWNSAKFGSCNVMCRMDQEINFALNILEAI